MFIESNYERQVFECSYTFDRVSHDEERCNFPFSAFSNFQMITWRFFCVLIFGN